MDLKLAMDRLDGLLHPLRNNGALPCQLQDGGALALRNVGWRKTLHLGYEPTALTN